MSIDNTVTVSPKFQVVIPRVLRERLKIKPGQKLQVFEIDGRIEMVPQVKASELRGFLPGLNTDIDRDRDRL